MTRIKEFLKRLLIVLLATIAGIVIVVVGINIYVRQSVKKGIVSEEEAAGIDDFDCIVVLGAAVNGNVPSHMLQDRLDKAVELYFAGCAPKIIMSGDHGGYYYDEVTTMKNYAVQAGVPSEDVFKDHSGYSTYDTIYRAKEIFGARKILVVSQEYHLPRCLYIAEKLGIEAYGVPARKIKYNGQGKRDIREILAIVKDFGKVIFKPESTELGDRFSLDGNGDDTNIRTELYFID